jgi:hypothetical protein
MPLVPELLVRLGSPGWFEIVTIAFGLALVFALMVVL